MTTDTIIRLIEIYAERRGLMPSTVSTYAMAHGDMYARLRGGHDITTRRAARVIQWFSDHWPTDLAWPHDIPRPAPEKDAA